ncbi:MAG: type II toxin-antitoxin system Phd/YefM family antitoxin [Candidatus Margulisbacteria bacterium]|jgi:PHD/YefM family antitoxin component YafN of YafNO toxin-antitoxin module|nr:type II toxin-antitoxin system Phd/YefM family antitoxin [Candidatus Margulisiibacteriota bacterium]
MPLIIPIKDLKNTSAISQMCQDATEPIYVTKNGYSNMVIMSARMYEERMFKQEVYRKLAESEEQFALGRTLDAKASLRKLSAKFKL